VTRAFGFEVPRETKTARIPISQRLEADVRLLIYRIAPRARID